VGQRCAAGCYLRRAQAAGIARSVLFATFHSDYAIANHGVARLVASDPRRFYGFAFVHARRDQGRILDLVRTAVERYGFVGIKAHRFDARISGEVCEAARFFGLPVLYDPMGEVAVAELLAQQYPDVNFILPHLGSFGDDWAAQLALIDHLVRHPNIHTDSAGVRRSICWSRPCGGRTAQAAVRLGRPVAASWPGIAQDTLAGIAAADAALVLGENFLRLARLA
jgi:predicted TIM-barrel fold metal-dependent hydrolase